MKKFSNNELINEENKLLENNNNKLTSQKPFRADDPDLEEVNEIVRQYRSQAKKTKAK